MNFVLLFFFLQIVARRKTIYEYHRVNFNSNDIKNDTFIYLTALPTCLDLTDCVSCVNNTILAFNVSKKSKLFQFTKFGFYVFFVYKWFYSVHGVQDYFVVQLVRIVKNNYGSKMVVNKHV